MAAPATTSRVAPACPPTVSAVSPADAHAWHAVARWRSSAPQPGWWRRAGGLALSGLRWLPGGRVVDDVLVDGATTLVLGPLREAGVRLGWLLAGDAAGVVRAVAAAGHDVATLSDLRRLDVDDLRAVRPSLGRVHVVAAGVRGGLAGLAAGAAAGASCAATGVAAAVATGGVDAVLAAATCSRAVARIALHYGYDPGEAAERAFALAVLAAGLSSDPTTAAPVPADPAPAAVGPVRRDHADAARVLPSALGVGLGVVLSARQIATVLETAEQLYTERFLREKYGALFDGSVPHGPGRDVVAVAG